MRIQKYLSKHKICSRREAETYIKMGLIKLNGVVIRDLGRQIDPSIDKVELLNLPPSLASKKITIAVNKPKNIVCSKNSTEGKTIFELLPKFAHLNTVGRLDKASEGLILLSNDGTVTNAVTGDKHTVEKEYEVMVRETIRPNHIQKIETGMMLDDGPTLPARAKMLAPHLIQIVLKEGRKHQIRRMLAELNLTIEKLRRVRVGNIILGDLNIGEYRQLTDKELSFLKK